jgi:hypothetical protein
MLPNLLKSIAKLSDWNPENAALLPFDIINFGKSKVSKPKQISLRL